MFAYFSGEKERRREEETRQMKRDRNCWNRRGFSDFFCRANQAASPLSYTATYKIPFHETPLVNFLSYVCYLRIAIQFPCPRAENGRARASARVLIRDATTTRSKRRRSRFFRTSIWLISLRDRRVRVGCWAKRTKIKEGGRKVEGKLERRKKLERREVGRRRENKKT